MRHKRGDFYTLDDAVSYGIRPMLRLEETDPEWWEVYVKLTSGTRVVYADKGTQAQAGRALLRLIKRISTMDKYLMSTLDNCFVDAKYVIRVYVDGQDNQYLGLAEDRLGESYRIAIGSQALCLRVASDAMQAIAAIQTRSEP